MAEQGAQAQGRLLSNEEYQELLRLRDLFLNHEHDLQSSWPFLYLISNIWNSFIRMLKQSNNSSNSFQNP